MPPCCASGGLLKYEGRVEQELAASTENQKGKAVEMIRYNILFLNNFQVNFYEWLSIFYGKIVSFFLRKIQQSSI